MHNKTHQEDILPHVARASHYLGNEINTVKKDWEAVLLHAALAFPDLYDIGTSHFGMQILYDLLNRDNRILAERVFTPAEDMEAVLRQKNRPLTSLESGIPLSRFDIIGFSLLYELNYTNILTILDLAGIPFRWKNRNNANPLIIAGGPCTVNPEPVADFFDAMVMGDGESVMPKLAETWISWKSRGAKDRLALLTTWSQIEGVYIPRFYKTRKNPDGFQVLRAIPPAPETIRRAIVADLDSAVFPEKPVIPFGRPVHDRLRLEVARGCTHGCRFCQAGMIYRPVRERSMKQILAIAGSSLASTGYDEISLLSLSTGDYGSIIPLLGALMDRYSGDHCAVSFPSLRVETLTPRLMAQIKRVRKTGFTIAVEAGSRRLRDVINKSVTEEDVIQTVRQVFQHGWKVIKLYFMVGLPTETREDITAIIDLVKKLRKIKAPRGQKPNLHVSIATFIPKAHTPFQWRGQISLDDARDKINHLRGHLKLPGVRVKWQNPEVSFLEGLFSRGDRRLSTLLETAYDKGCRLDGWSDRFRFDLWRKALTQSGVDPDDYVTRKRSVSEPLPWDHMDIRVKKSYLVKEYQNALNSEITGDCRRDACRDCGVCDFKHLQPIRYDEPPKTEPAVGKLPSPTAGLKIWNVTYEKTGPARFFGHLEMANIISRTVRRAGIHVAYSAGFHPMPKISYKDALPVGMESRAETLVMTTAGVSAAKDIISGLNRELPTGLHVRSCREIRGKKDIATPGSVSYRIQSGRAVFLPSFVDRFNAQKIVAIEKTNKKGQSKTIDLKKRILELHVIDDCNLEMTMSMDQGRTLRPDEVLSRIFDVTNSLMKDLRVTKTGMPARRSI